MTRTKGNIVIENIKIGDIHYEFDYGCGVKCEVISLPVRSDDGSWTWQSRNVNTDKIIDYMVSEQYTHYGPNLYNYEAYQCSHWL